MTFKEAYLAAFNETDINREFTTKQIIERVEKIKSDGITPQPSDFCYNITNKQYRNVYATHLHLFMQKENGTYIYLGPNALYKGAVTNKIQETGETVVVGDWIDGVYRERKSAWLLTWNPENWEWKDNVTETSWSCRSKGVQVGDTIYVIKVGEMPRGIMASGIATSEPIEEPHWDKDKRNSGLTTRSINVKFNTILDVETDSYLDQSVLKNLFPDQEWSPMGSGIRIKEEYVERLAEEWDKVVKQKNITKKYSVFDSVWIAAALMSYEKYYTIDNPNITDMLLKQSLIRSRAQQLTDDNVDSARISWWCCADAEKHVYNYLREVKDSQTPWRRLIGTNEMNGEKECPQDLNDADTLKTSLGPITMSKLKNFVDNEYTDLVKTVVRKYNINCKEILTYLETNNGKDYMDPMKAPNGSDRQNYERLKELGGNAVKELDKLADLCTDKFGLQKYGKSNWLDGSYTKIREYLWRQLKLPGYEECPSSISLFAEIPKGEKTARFRVSLELDDKLAKFASEDHKKHHKLLDIPLDMNNDLLYILGGNNSEEIMKTLSEPIETVREKLKAGIYKKIQISKIVSCSSEMDDNTIVKQILNGVSAILKYYNHVIGNDSNNDLSTMVAKVDKLLLKYNCYKEATKSGNDEEYYIRWNDTQETLLVFRVGLTSSVWQLNDRIQELANLDEDMYPIREINMSLNRRITFYDTQESTMEAIEKLIVASINSKGYDTQKITNKEEYVMDKNIILYGPPGTGKTYNSVNYAVAIIENKPVEEIKKENYRQILLRYNQYKKEKKISFTTFHQSYGYEEFIEGIRPNLVSDEVSENSGDIEYSIVPGIFKSFCDNAKAKKVSYSFDNGVRMNPTVWKVSLEGSKSNPTKTDCFENNRIRIGWANRDKHITDESQVKSSKERNILFNFESGMQKGDLVVTLYDQYSIDAIGVVVGDYEWLEDGGHYPRSRKVNWLVKNIQEDITSINNGKVMTSSTVYRLNLSPEDIFGIVSKYNTNSQVSIDKNNNNYVFIIDEINRGNISKIFGELITLIETTKRLGNEEEMAATLPYSGQLFAVPNNVFILGTMNTADRSIALLDTALRRRFTFVEMMPDSSVLNDIPDINGINMTAMLDAINMRIEYLYDREHTIGHAYFTPLKNDPTLIKLESIFKNAIIPLLQEYFYEDYSKIQMVLADNVKQDENKFILDERLDVKRIFKTQVDVDLPEVKYSINNNAFKLAESYIQIY